MTTELDAPQMRDTTVRVIPEDRTQIRVVLYDADGTSFPARMNRQTALNMAHRLIDAVADAQSN